VARVEFEREGVVVEAAPGQTLLAVAESAQVQIFRGMWPDLHCGKWKGWCNRCKVWVRGAPEAINPPTAAEQSRLRLNGRVSGSLRLACQVEVRGDLRVHTRAGGPPVAPEVRSSGPRWKNTVEVNPAGSPAAPRAEPKTE
jgi:ferredoxin